MKWTIGPTEPVMLGDRLVGWRNRPRVSLIKDHKEKAPVHASLTGRD